jgi:non-ribosomal peptide synthetase component F
MRAGVLYRLYERTGDKRAGEAAIAQYILARKAWSELAEKARGVYVSDITVGEHPQLRGHWLDRLPAIDQDIADMRRKVQGASLTKDARLENATAEILRPPGRSAPAVTHKPPARFARGAALNIDATASAGSAMRLYYRRVDQAERWESAGMENRDGRFRASIPATYTDSAFPLQYYFEMRMGDGPPAMYPGFTRRLNNQPYFVVRQG